MSSYRSPGAIGPRDIAAAARLGMAATATDRADGLAEAMTVMCDVFRADAIAFTSLARDGASTVARRGYPEPVADALSVEFPRSQWMSLVRSAAVPPSVSTEEPATFRDGWFYAEHLAPAGYKDGLTGPLSGRARAGLVHLSAADPRAFDHDRRAVLGALLPTLGHVLDLAVAAPGRETIVLPRPTGRASADANDTAPTWARTTAWRAAVSPLATADDRVRGWVRDGSSWRRVDVRGGPTHLTLEVSALQPALPHHLTARELDVLTALACGMTDAAIAEALGLSARTVHTHQQRIRQRLGVASRVVAAATAARDGLIGLDTPCAAGAVRRGTAAR